MKTWITQTAIPTSAVAAMIAAGLILAVDGLLAHIDAVESARHMEAR